MPTDCVSAFPLPIIPVVDLLGGRVVRGVGGRRSEYLPVRSALTESTAPAEVAAAVLRAAAADSLYVADLDAITARRPDLASVGRLCALGATVLCDGGAREPDDVLPYLDLGVGQIVVGTETASRRTVEALLARFGPVRVVLSIDLMKGRLLGDAKSWVASRDGLARLVAGLGVATVIVLDLARVGEGEGPGTEALIAELKAAAPGLRVIAGGGVRDRRDLERLARAGANAALVASALQDGRLSSTRPASASRPPSGG